MKRRRGPHYVANKDMAGKRTFREVSFFTAFRISSPGTMLRIVILNVVKNDKGYLSAC